MTDAAERPALPASPAELEAALRLFDETTRALDARARRLEEVLTVKQEELVRTNRRLEEQLAEVDRLSAWLNLLLASVSSGVVAIDTAGLITTCNPAAENALAGLRQDLIGSDHRQLFPGSPLERVLVDGERVAWDHQVPGADGRPRLLEGRLSPIRDSDGVLLGAVEIFEDVTEMRRLREEAERGERLRALGEMAAGVAHEIRNPLNGIEGFASLLQRDLAVDDPRHRYAEAVIAGVRHLNETVSGLLAFTRPKMPQRRPVPLGALLDSCRELVQVELDQAGDGGVTVELEDAAVVDRWPCDPTQIRQVVLNLLQNAVQAATERHGAEARVLLSLALVAGEDGSRCQIAVEDNGPGVPEEERKRIFTPFHTTKDRGTGLGLAVAHTMVSLHGGAIAVDDSLLGGARFRITLPAE